MSPEQMASMFIKDYEVELLPLVIGSDVVRLADANTGLVVSSISLPRAVSEDSDESRREALTRVKDKLARELTHLAGSLQRLPEHLA